MGINRKPQKSAQIAAQLAGSTTGTVDDDDPNEFGVPADSRKVTSS